MHVALRSARAGTPGESFCGSPFDMHVTQRLCQRPARCIHAAKWRKEVIQRHRIIGNRGFRPTRCARFPGTSPGRASHARRCTKLRQARYERVCLLMIPSGRQDRLAVHRNRRIEADTLRAHIVRRLVERVRSVFVHAKVGLLFSARVMLRRREVQKTIANGKRL